MIALRRVHRTSAIAVTLFAVLHVANHLMALGSVDAHLRFMRAARLVYRQPLVEAVLLLCVSVQAASGLALLRTGWQRRSGVAAWLQAGSGAWLALFLAIHVAAVLFGRLVSGLDTNLHYAAAGLHVWPYQAFFLPYYFLAVAALFTHLGCVVSRRAVRTPGLRAVVLGASVCVGVVASAAILAALMGALYPYEVPARYLASFGPG
jgi:hypothetical protein